MFLDNGILPLKQACVAGAGFLRRKKKSRGRARGEKEIKLSFHVFPSRGPFNRRRLLRKLLKTWFDQLEGI